MPDAARYDFASQGNAGATYLLVDFDLDFQWSRKPAARLGEVPFANKVSYRGSGGRACQQVTKSRN